MSHQSLLHLFLVTLLTLLSLRPASSQSPTCGGAGYDLSSLSSANLSYQDSAAPSYYSYYVRPCGNVANANCSSGGAMFCQYSATKLGYTVLATYNDSVSTWLAVTGGVQQIVQDGALCATINAYRAATLFYHCNASASTAYISSVTQYQTCHWRATIETQAACTATGATAGHAVGNSFYDARCGAGVYDLSSVSSQPLALNSGGVSAALQLCGPLATSSCSQSASSACLTPSTGSATSLAAYNASQQIWTIDANGITLHTQTGDYCATSTASTALTVHLVCNATARPAQLTALTQGETCSYTATVQTAAACARIDVASSSSATAAGGAGVPGSSSGGGPSNGAAAGAAGVGGGGGARVLGLWVVGVFVMLVCGWMG